MEDGQKITFSGEADEEPGIPAGDVVIILDEKEHSVFKRRKRNLYLKMNISLVEALCGFERYFETLDNRWLKIKTVPGEVIKPKDVRVVMDEGMPTYGRSFQKGKLFVEFHVTFPEDGFFSEKMVKNIKSLLPNVEEPIIPDDADEYELEEIDPDNKSRYQDYVSVAHCQARFHFLSLLISFRRQSVVYCRPGFLKTSDLIVVFCKGVFIWRRPSPLGRASPSKRAEFHLAFTWGFFGSSSRAGCSARVNINFSQPS